MADDELIDIVDHADRPIRMATRAEAHATDATHRGVHIFIFKDSSCEEMLLQQRSKNKSVSPLKWCHSASGHLLAGQTYVSGAIHELDELFHGKAVPIHIVQSLHKFCSFRLRDSASNNELITLFTLVYDGKFEIDPDEVERIEYKKVATLAKELEMDPSKYTRAFHQTFAVFMRLGEIYQSNGVAWV